MGMGMGIGMEDSIWKWKGEDREEAWGEWAGAPRAWHYKCSRCIDHMRPASSDQRTATRPWDDGRSASSVTFLNRDRGSRGGRYDCTVAFPFCGYAVVYPEATVSSSPMLLLPG